MLKLILIITIISFASCAGNTLRFLAMGDWGGKDTDPYYTLGEHNVAQTMNKIVGNNNYQFTLAVGDNFYYHGVTNEQDSRFKSTFEDVFSGINLINFPFYVVAGNHDHRKNVTAQIEYSKISKRWNFPSLWYTFEEKIGSTGKTAQFIMIDTVILSGYCEDPEDVFCEELVTSHEHKLLADQQWTWIEEQMASSTADHLFVAGHYPVYSSCSHGNTQDLIIKLKPLLEKYNAHNIAGHDHCQVYVKYNKVGYFLSGTGHECCYKGSKASSLPANSLKFSRTHSNKGSTQGGFAAFHVHPDYFYAVFLTDQGTVEHTSGQYPARNVTQIRLDIMMNQEQQ